MLSRKFWVDAVERMVRTVAQAALSILTISGATDLLTVNWQGVVSASALAGIISLLMSIVGSGSGNKETAAIVELPPETTEIE